MGCPCCAGINLSLRTGPTGGFQAAESEERTSLQRRGWLGTLAADAAAASLSRLTRGSHWLRMFSALMKQKGFSPYSLIAFISGPAPRILIARFKL
jgi:hypothetical protein